MNLLTYLKQFENWSAELHIERTITMEPMTITMIEPDAPPSDTEQVWCETCKRFSVGVCSHYDESRILSESVC